MSKVPESVRNELAALAALPESDIDFSDLPATKASDWHGAVHWQFYRPVKQRRQNHDSVTFRAAQGYIFNLNSC